MNELHETIGKIYEEELPGHLKSLTEQERIILRSINTFNVSRNGTSEDWEQLDDLVNEMREVSFREGFISGFSYALTFMEKVYGLSDLPETFGKER